jgi:PAS domain S-box-containing protein
MLDLDNVRLSFENYEPSTSWQHLPFSYLAEGVSFDAFAFRQIIDSLPQCIFWKDRSGSFLGCNAAGAQAVGLSHAEEIVGKTDFDFHHDFHVADFLRLEDERVMASGTSIYRDLSKGSGQPESARWYETSKAPLRATTGEVVGLMISYEDVTERMRAEETLRQANEHLDVAANYTLNWNWWVDQNGQMRWISPSVEASCGYSLFDCFGMLNYPFPIIHPDDRGRMRSFLAKNIPGDDECEFRFIHKCGSVLWGSIDLRQVVDRHGKLLGVRYSVHDITARKQAEAELLALNHSLEERVAEAIADGMKQERLMLLQSRHAAMGEMIGMIAHQWRQPLTTLGLLLQNIQYDCLGDKPGQDDASKRFNQAYQVIEDMSSTIDDFRNFFRSDAKAAPISPSECMGKVLVLMEASLKRAQIQVKAQLSATGKAVGVCNELGQALLNLVTNAKDALVQYRSKDRTINCEVTDGDREITVRIANNAGHIAPEHMEKIFDPYFTTKPDGTGLGLYIARRIVDQHFHGMIECANTNDGVEFIITLPRDMRFHVAVRPGVPTTPYLNDRENPMSRRLPIAEYS